MRKTVVLGVVILAFLGGVLWLLRAGAPESSSAGLGDPAVERDDDARAAAVADRLRERFRASAQAGLPEAKGTLEIRGRVLGPQGPAAGATVTATLAEVEDALSELPCECGHACGMKLLECGCGEAAAQVLALVAERRGEAQPMAQTTTAADGTFVLTGLESRAYAVWAVAAEGVGVRKGVQAGGTVDVSLAEGVTLRGRVVDEEKKPIAGAVVTAIYASHSRFFDALSESDGSFQIGPAPQGKYSLVAVYESLLPDKRTISSVGPSQPELVLRRPRHLVGRVLRSDAPVARALVSLDGEHRKEQVRTDILGAFSFARLRPGSYSVGATEGPDVASLSAVIEETGEPAPLVLRLESGAELDGVVTAKGGGPVEGAQVTVSIEARGKEPSLHATTDAQGSFRLAPVPMGKLSIQVRAEGYLRADRLDRMLLAGQREHVEVALEKAATLSGRVLDPDGEPVNGARVEVDIVKPASEVGASESRTTDDEGAFRLYALQAGHATLSVTHPDFNPVTREVDVPATGLVVSLEAGARIHGVVVDENGRPLPGAQVLIASARRSGSDEEPAGRRRVVTADIQGRFRAGGLGSGHYVLGAMVEDGASVRGGRKEVVLPTEEEITLQLDVGLAITGTVVDEAGRGVADVEMFASDEDEKEKPEELPVMWQMAGGLHYAAATSHEDGTFAFEHLAAGSYRVELDSKRYTLSGGQRFVRVAAGESNVRVVVTSGPRVLGRVLGPDRTPLGWFKVNGQSFSGADGTFEYPVLQPGELTLLFDAGPGLAQTTRTVQVPPKGEVNLGDVVLTSGSSVTGRVVDARTGEPVAGALVEVRDPPTTTDEGLSLSIERGAVRTSLDGSFTLPNADARTPYLFVQHEEYLDVMLPLSTRTGLVIQAHRGGVVEGRVLLASGEGVRARVWILGTKRASVITGNDGRFRVAGLAPGDYTVQAESRAEHAFPATAVKLQGTEVVQVELVESQRGTSVLVRVEGGDRGNTYALLVPGAVAAPETFQEMMKIAISTIESEKTGPEFRFRPVSPGFYTILFGTSSDEGLTVQAMSAEVTGGPDQTFVARVDPAAKRLSSSDQDQEGAPPE